MLLTAPAPPTLQSAQWNDPGSSLQPLCRSPRQEHHTWRSARCLTANPLGNKKERVWEKRGCRSTLFSPLTISKAANTCADGLRGVPPAAVPREGAGRLPRLPCSQPLFSRLLMSFQVGAPAQMKQMTFWARFCSQQAGATVTDWLKHED